MSLEAAAVTIRGLLFADVFADLLQLKAHRGHCVSTGPEVLAREIPLFATQAGHRYGALPFQKSLSVKNRLDEAKFRCFPVKRTLRRQECTPRRSGGERTVYLSCSTKRFPPSCCFASRRRRSNETDAGRQVQRKLLAAGPANHTRGSRNRHGGDWLRGRPQGEGFRNPESGFCDRCGDVLRV